jgi:hypothetical protein
MSQQIFEKRYYGNQALLTNERINQHQTITASIAPNVIADSGKIYNNRGAAGAVTITLPAPSAANAGARFGAMRITIQNVVLSAPAGTIQSAAGTTGTTLTATGAGNTGIIQLECDGTAWIILHQTGTWTLA